MRTLHYAMFLLALLPAANAAAFNCGQLGLCFDSVICFFAGIPQFIMGMILCIQPVFILIFALGIAGIFVLIFKVLRG